MPFGQLSRRHVLIGLGSAAIAAYPGALLADQPYIFVTAEVPPYSLPSDEGRTGFVIDVVRELLTRLEAPFEIVSLPWKRAMETLQQNDNVLMAPLARTPGREQKFRWVVPILTEEVRLYSIDGGPVLDLETARGLESIAVQSGSAMEELGQSLGFDNLFPAPDNFSMVRMLAYQHADAMISLRALAIHTMEAEGFDPNRLVPGAVLNRFDVSIAASLDTPDEIIIPIQATFEGMRADGSLNSILRKYGLASTQSEPTPKSTEGSL